MDWFLYDRNLTHERVKLSSTVKLRNLTDLTEKSLTFFIKKLRRPSTGFQIYLRIDRRSKKLFRKYLQNPEENINVILFSNQNVDILPKKEPHRSQNLWTAAFEKIKMLDCYSTHFSPVLYMI